MVSPLTSVVCAYWKAGLENADNLICLVTGLPAYHFQINLSKSRNIQLPIVRPYPPPHPTTRQYRRPQTTRKKKFCNSTRLPHVQHRPVLSTLINSKNYKTDNTLHAWYFENVCVCVYVKMRLKIKSITFSTNVEKSNIKDYRISPKIWHRNFQQLLETPLYIYLYYEDRTESHEQFFFFCMRTGNSRRRRVRW